MSLLLLMSGASFNPSSPPSPAKLSFITWRDQNEAYRLAQVPLTGTTTYYFANKSSGGNDANSGLTTGAPKETIAAAQALAVSDNLLLFNRGDTWVFTDKLTNAFTLTSGKIGAYGSGSLPRWTRFVGQTFAWSLVGGNQYSSVSLATDPAWLRIIGSEYTRPLTRATDVANNASTSDSFFYDTGASKMYINLGGTNPATLTYEITNGIGNGTGSGTVIDVDVAGDRTRVDSIFFDGIGLHSQDGVIQTYTCVADGLADNQRIVISNCKMRYTGYHATGCVTSSQGVVATIVSNDIGLARLGPGNGASMIINFANSGGSKCIIAKNTVDSGNLFENGIGRIAECVLGHTNSGELDWTFVYKNTMTAGANSCLVAPGMSGSHTPSDVNNPATYKTILMSNVMQETSARTITVSGAPGNQLQINEKYSGNLNGGWSSGTGMTVNCEIVGFGSASFFWSIFKTTSNGGTFINNRLRGNGLAGPTFGQGQDAANWANMRAWNNEFMNDYPDPDTSLDKYSGVNLSNVASDQENNVYSGTDPVTENALTIPTGTAGAGTINCTGKVMITRGNIPASGTHGTYTGHDGASATRQWDYDINEVSRGSTTEMGPYSK